MGLSLDKLFGTNMMSTFFLSNGSCATSCASQDSHRGLYCTTPDWFPGKNLKIIHLLYLGCVWVLPKRPKDLAALDLFGGQCSVTDGFGFGLISHQRPNMSFEQINKKVSWKPVEATMEVNP